MSRKTLTNGVSLKVENRSGFDKSFFNALTTGVGTITPIVKQLVIPHSSGKCRIKISAQLPPLATDAYLRSHLKLEAFFTPLRLCYGGFESWMCGREVYDNNNSVFVRANLPRLAVPSFNEWSGTYNWTTGVNKATVTPADVFDPIFGAGSLLDYFGAYWKSTEDFDSGHSITVEYKDMSADPEYNDEPYALVNIFPWLCYGLIYDEYYRNKFVERPLFSPPAARGAQDYSLESTALDCWNLPYVSSSDLITVLGGSRALANSDGALEPETPSVHEIYDGLLNGTLTQLRQRNYGDDYFTAAMPSAQEGNPVSVSVVNNAFTIASLRLANQLQEFSEINGYASPDYLQTLRVRYGASLSYGVAQKPVFLGSADFPMYTSGVEQTAQGTSQAVNNPFDTVGARYGRAHAEGTEFVCDFNADEPGYFMVMATLVPEAQYFQGISKDLMLFVDSGSIVDLPVATFENIGNEAISELELSTAGQDNVFGYVQRYLWHKLGNRNQVHGKFRMDENLGAFVVQRDMAGVQNISSSFLKVKTTDLDNVAAVSSGVSGFGVMIDSAIDLFISEPLSESAIPSLVDPAKEHGHSVYVKTGGSKLA